MKNPIRITFGLAALALIGNFHAGAGPVPAELPDPDGKPGDASQPVKVYILAGQSNMVGMGNLSGATNVYDGVYLSSDPARPRCASPDLQGRELQDRAAECLPP